MARGKNKDVDSHSNTGPVTSDPRFSIIHTDPRFARTKKKDVKIPIDSRFKAAFKDKEFIDQPSVDRYGRKLPKNETKRLVKKFYHLDEDDEEDDDEGLESEQEEDPARGIGTVSSSEEEDSDNELEDETKEALVEEDIPKGSATSRLAAVNLDWDHIRAVDVLAVLQSFIPPTSEEVVRKVSVYPSEFGKERIREEAIQGPAIDLKAPSNTNTDDDQVDTTALRKYQLERLRYYYAIIECSSISIANTLYKSLDGAELGATANLLDLRFVPDDVTFDDTPRDTATSVPDDHEPADFVTDALQHSKPKLTWEAEDPGRKRLISEAFKRDAESGKWEALLGSSDDDEEEEKNAEDVRDKYRQLLLGGDDSMVPDQDLDDDQEDQFFGQERHAIAPLETQQKEETTLEKYKRKEQERKQRRRQEKLAQKQQTSTTPDLGFNDPLFADSTSTSAKRKEKQQSKRAEKLAAEISSAQKAGELDLLMHDEQGPQQQDGNHFNINHILKAQKASKFKKKKKRDAEKEIYLQEGFEMDVHDPRFADVFTGGDFAIDPNNAAFKKGLVGMEALLQETRRRKHADGDEVKAVKKVKRR